MSRNYRGKELGKSKAGAKLMEVKSKEQAGNDWAPSYITGSEKILL